MDLLEANTLSHCLLEKVLEKLHMTKDIVSNKYMIRFCVNSKDASIEDIKYAWSVIKDAADQVISDYKNKSPLKENELENPIEISSNNLNFSKCILTVLYLTKSKRRLAINRILAAPVKNEPQDWKLAWLNELSCLNVEILWSSYLGIVYLLYLKYLFIIFSYNIYKKK